VLNQPECMKPYPKHLDWLRYFCAFVLYTYGVSKLLHLQFNLSSELAQRPIGSLNGYQLTWFYFGYSRIYACILGLTQLTGATLLLFRKTTLLVALTMLPVMVNILLINVFILVNDYGPYVISALISTTLLVILWHQRAALFTLLWANSECGTGRVAPDAQMDSSHDNASGEHYHDHRRDPSALSEAVRPHGATF
jgi:hypothetical protein